MALRDWLWLVRLIMEILKLIADLPAEELQAIAKLRDVIEVEGPPGGKSKTTRKT